MMIPDPEPAALATAPASGSTKLPSATICTTALQTPSSPTAASGRSPRLKDTDPRRAVRRESTMSNSRRGGPPTHRCVPPNSPEPTKPGV
jgi:hypothetical protein